MPQYEDPWRGKVPATIKKANYMARFQKIVNIWADNVDVSKLQRGQWVEAGEGGDRGIFGGVTQGGSVIVAWYRNAKAKRAGGYRGYVKNMMVYAKCWSVKNGN